MTTATLSDQVNTASTLVGLLLALNTLFTAEQARRLSDERLRTGGARRDKLRTIRWTSIALALVTIAALASLFPLFRDVIEAVGTRQWQSVLAVFELTWLLLVALAVWQISLAVRSQ